MLSLRWPFAAGRRRRERIDAAVAALEDGATAAWAEARRLGEAVAVSHAALALIHDRLLQLAEHPGRIAAAEARARELVDHAQASLTAASADIGTRIADRLAEEIAPARAAAELHATVLRASIERLRGETTALDGAEQAAQVLVALSGSVQTGLSDTLAALTRRSDQAASAAERAVARIEAVAARLDTPAPARARRRASEAM